MEDQAAYHPQLHSGVKAMGWLLSCHQAMYLSPSHSLLGGHIWPLPIGTR